MRYKMRTITLKKMIVNEIRKNKAVIVKYDIKTFLDVYGLKIN